MQDGGGYVRGARRPVDVESASSCLLPFSRPFASQQLSDRLAGRREGGHCPPRRSFSQGRGPWGPQLAHLLRSQRRRAVAREALSCCPALLRKREAPLFCVKAILLLLPLIHSASLAVASLSNIALLVEKRAARVTFSFL